MSARPDAPDAIIVGSGLAGSLVALRLADARPELTLLVVERDERAGGSHTWSFHETDVDEATARWLAPLVESAWDAQRIRFPDRPERRMRAGYRSITSDTVRAALGRAPNIHVATGTEVAGLDGHRVTLGDGETVPAPLVIDARGAAPSPHLTLAWQKFVGLVLDVPGGHGLLEPVIMDARVEQVDGFRFVYLLPHTPTRLLIEDTRYSDGSDLDREGMRAAVLLYAAERAWGERVVHEEEGVLPIALAADMKALWRDAAAGGAVPVGMRAGLFHAMTGYSLPLAVRTADLVAASPDLTSAGVGARVRGLAFREGRRQRFERLLARMLFRGCPPERRWIVMRRFYDLREGLIERFYAGRSTWADRLRILSGRPPIPVRDALPCLPERPLLGERSLPRTPRLEPR